MKNKALFFILLSMLVLGCKEKNPKEQAKFLEGYWEIDKVEVGRDSTIDYSINQTIDYIEIEGNTGQRTKVQPQLDGSYKTSNSAEKMELKTEGAQLKIHYKTPYDSWIETVIEASEDHLIVKNAQDKIYHYNRFTPINIDHEKE